MYNIQGHPESFLIHTHKTDEKAVQAKAIYIVERGSQDRTHCSVSKAANLYVQNCGQNAQISNAAYLICKVLKEVKVTPKIVNTKCFKILFINFIYCIKSNLAYNLISQIKQFNDK